MEDCNLYITNNENLQEEFSIAALHCLNGAWRDVKTSNGLLLSLLGYLCNFDPKPFYADLWYNPIEVVIEEEALVKLQTEHLSKPYEDRHIRLGNLELLLLILGKRIDESSYIKWAEARVKPIFRIYNAEFKVGYLQQLLNVGWATNLSKIYRYSHGIRVNVMEFLLMARLNRECGMVAKWGDLRPVFEYICKMLSYARLKGILLIQKHLIEQWQRPILGDRYLSADREHLAAAIRAWASFPPNKLVYAGLLATDEVFHLLSGSQLHRLTYIANRVGALHNSSFENYKCKAPPDKKECDALVETYFSPNAKLPEGVVTVRSEDIIFGLFHCSKRMDFFRFPFADHLLNAIAARESLLKEEQRDAREYLAKQKIVGNIMLEMERLSPLTKQDAGVPSETEVEESKTEVRGSSLQRDSENYEPKGTVLPSEKAGSANDICTTSDAVNKQKRRSTL